MEPVLQVALDLVHGDRALQIASEAVAGGAEWIEAGTPLIKSEGVEIVRRLKKAFPDRTIVADMKTIDVGGAEVEIAAKSGADVVVVLGLSSDPTITEAVMSARQYGAKIMVDLFNVKDKAARAKEAEGMGAAYVCVHVGVDEQMVGGSPLAELKGVAECGRDPSRSGRRHQQRVRGRCSRGRGINSHRRRGHHQGQGRDLRHEGCHDSHGRGEEGPH